MLHFVAMAHNSVSTTTSSSSYASTSTTSNSSVYDSESPIGPNVTQLHQYGTVVYIDDGSDDDSNKNISTIQCCSILLRHLVIFMGLTVGTYVGVSARIGLSVFSNWDGIIHFPSFWAQVVGTLIIGAATAQKENMQQSLATLYTIITTGICGSLTTFSSWNAEASKVLLQLNNSSFQPIHHAIDGGRIVGFLTVLLLGIGMPVSVFYLGKNTSKSLSDTCNLKNSTVFDSLLCLRRRWIVPFINTFVFIMITAVIITACYFTGNYEFLFSLLFGGPGTYIRWRLGALDKMNARFVKDFPFGTFLSNIIGSLILAVTLVSISYCSTQIVIGDIPLAVLKGIAVGFCGSLTTVSTFVSQLCSLPFCMSFFYAAISLVSSQLVFNTVFLVYQGIV